jgi:hypothetical protein
MTSFWHWKLKYSAICSTFFYFFSRGNLESGSFSYMRNSVRKYARNSAEFRGIPVIFTAKNTAEFRGIPYFFQKIPYSIGSQKRTSVDTLVAPRTFTSEFCRVTYLYSVDPDPCVIGQQHEVTYLYRCRLRHLCTREEGGVSSAFREIFF